MSDIRQKKLERPFYEVFLSFGFIFLLDVFLSVVIDVVYYRQFMNNTVQYGLYVFAPALQKFLLLVLFIGKCVVYNKRIKSKISKAKNIEVAATILFISTYYLICVFIRIQGIILNLKSGGSGTYYDLYAGLINHHMNIRLLLLAITLFAVYYVIRIFEKNTTILVLGFLNIGVCLSLSLVYVLVPFTLEGSNALIRIFYYLMGKANNLVVGVNFIIIYFYFKKAGLRQLNFSPTQ